MILRDKRSVSYILFDIHMVIESVVAAAAATSQIQNGVVVSPVIGLGYAKG
jgi:hypothetical protein